MGDRRYTRRFHRFHKTTYMLTESLSDTSAQRHTVTAMASGGSTLAVANLSPTLPGSLLNITRRWTNLNGQLQLLFDVTNSNSNSVEIGSFGMPQGKHAHNCCVSLIPFQNGTTYSRTGTLLMSIRTAPFLIRTLAWAQGMFRYITQLGQDQRFDDCLVFEQVTPLIGTAPALVITPANNISSFEGWRFLTEDTSETPFYQSQTFEGLYEWQTHTLAYAQNEWANVTPWNAPTSRILPPGATVTFGLQLQLAPSIRGIESTVRAAGLPVAVGIPGYILPMDQVGKLFLNYSAAVHSITVTPSGALTLSPNTDSSSGLVGYDITPVTWGRARLQIDYANGINQTVHYYVQEDSTNAM